MVAKVLLVEDDRALRDALAEGGLHYNAPPAGQGLIA